MKGIAYYGIFEGLAEDRDWSVHHKPWRVNIDALLGRIAGFAPRTGRRLAPSPSPTADPCRPSFWSVADLTGESYKIVLERFHRIFQPQTYLEIGVSEGTTLGLASSFSIAIDPHFGDIKAPFLNDKPACCLYRMKSDSFFGKFNPTAIFGQSIDMAFLDGMHWFEFLLRDFINVERHCRRNSIVFLHDCLPVDAHVGRRDVEDQGFRDRSTHPGWWAGDVWKTLAILLKFRPDLRVTAFDSEPTGLVAITCLDPSSTILADRYFELVEDYKDRTLAEHGDRYFSDLTIVPSGQYASREALSSLFWL